MKTWKILKQHLFFGTILVLVLAVVPVMAGIGLNTFSPGEPISSSQVNENFSNLEEQINHICQLPGQVIFSGLVNTDGAFEGSSFICDDITLSPEDNGPEVQFTLGGIATQDLSIHAFPVGSADRSCSVVVFSAGFDIECFDDVGDNVDIYFFLTLIRRN